MKSSRGPSRPHTGIFSPWNIIHWFFIVAGSCMLFVGGLFLYYAKDLPRPEKFTEMSFIQPTRIYDRTGTHVLYEIYGEQRRQVVPLSDMSPNLRQAVVATEDANFYHHFGLDWRGIARALWADIAQMKRVAGGSTISQQLVRNSFLTRNKTVGRKIQEVILALQLERAYPKDKILEFYLNQIPFGPNLYGVASAAQEYFAKQPQDLTIAESAALAAMIKAPTYYSPFGLHKDDLLARKDYVIDRMEKVGSINAREAQSAKDEQLHFQDPSHAMKAPHFVSEILDYLNAQYGEKFLQDNGLRVYTTIDWNIQQFAEQSIADYAKRNESLNAYNEALAAIDPKTGEVLALVGSKDWYGTSYPAGCVSGKNCLFDPKYDVVTSLPGRQPGSSFKPFVYATAFKKGYDDTTVVADEQTNFGVWGGVPYAPQNFDGKFRGPVTLRQALAQSLNVPSVKVFLDLAGIADSIKTAKDMGITTLSDNPADYGPSLVLGGGEVKLIDMVSSYGVFATGGKRISPVEILQIKDSDGNVLEENKKTPIQVLDAHVTDLITSILSDNQARAPIFGAHSPLYFDNAQVAAKTGTTQDYKDGWIIGYTGDLVSGVWTGNNDGTLMNKEPGTVLAGPIWHEFMQKTLDYLSQNAQNPPTSP